MSDPEAPPPPPAAKDSLTVEVGGWFKAHATGVGVLAIPLVLVILGLLAMIGGALH